MPVTVTIEKFVSGPATEVRKLNLMADAILELQMNDEVLEMKPKPKVTTDELECVVLITGQLYSVVFKTNGQTIKPITG